MKPAGAVAIDLGATSVRFAAGRLDEGRILSEVIAQRAHAPLERNGRLEWDFNLLVGIATEAVAYAADHFREPTFGIDAWGVDHGFVDRVGAIVQSPVAYRDPSHQTMFERLSAHQPEIYAGTGIQHQPFNTLYQLAARAEDQPSLIGSDWMLTPDLIGFLLTGTRHTELTMASTTQLMGLTDTWWPRAFEIIGWPLPDRVPRRPGQVLGDVDGVRWVSVGSHDTASAVLGLGPLRDDQAFLNVGTWSLLGTVVDQPILTDPGFTNERTVDARIRYLANIPGFYVINRVHEELGLNCGVPEWLAMAKPTQAAADLMRPEFFNPPRMTDLLAAQLSTAPTDVAEWASLALNSLVQTTVAQLRRLEDQTSREFSEIRLSGGGSQSRVFAQALADASGRPVIAGPVESTVLGNLAMQFYAQGAFSGWDDLLRTVGASFTTVLYSPR